jgi:hypothetical protein
MDEQNEKTVLPSGRTECDNSTNKWSKYDTKIVRIGRTEGENSSKMDEQKASTIVSNG